jgi:hypothetical protein
MQTPHQNSLKVGKDGRQSLNGEKSVGFRNRLLVLIDWTWDYLFSEHSVRLIVPTEIHSGRGFTVMQIPEMEDAVGVKEF